MMNHNDKSPIMMSFAASLKEGHSRSVAETFGAASRVVLLAFSGLWEAEQYFMLRERSTHVSDQFYDNLISALRDSPNQLA